MASDKRNGFDNVDAKVLRDDEIRYPVQISDETEVKNVDDTTTEQINEQQPSLDSAIGSMKISSFSSQVSQGSMYESFDAENVYAMDHPRRGYCVIINNRRFIEKLNVPERSGTDLDATTLYTTFKKLGFDVVIRTDMKCVDMLRLFVDYGRKDHSENDCFAAAILSHGDDGVVYGTDDIIEIQKLAEPLKSCKTLFGKPKLFFIQACQGYTLDEGNDATDAEILTDGEQRIARLPREADFLFSYSTSRGYFSFRNSTKGSYYVQALGKVLQEYGAKLEITRLLTRVSRMVAVDFESKTQERAFNKKKQQPCFISALTKDLYFPQKF